jgi:hypothetical protein
VFESLAPRRRPLDVTTRHAVPAAVDIVLGHPTCLGSAARRRVIERRLGALWQRGRNRARLVEVKLIVR